MKNLLLFFGLIFIIPALSQNDFSLILDQDGQISTSSIFNLEEGAISFYFKADSSDFVVGETKTILSLEDATGDNILAIRIGEPTANTPNWSNGIAIAGKRTYTDTILYRFKWTQTPASELYNNEWHHILISVNNGNFTFGIDGSAEPTNGSNFMLPFAYPSSIFVNGSTFTVGTTTCALGGVDNFIDYNGNNLSNGAFVGLIDDLTFFNAPISGTDYESNFNNGIFCYNTGELVIFDFENTPFTDLIGFDATDQSTDIPYINECGSFVAPPFVEPPSLLITPNPVEETLISESVEGLLGYRVLSSSGIEVNTTLLNEQPFKIDVSNLPVKRKYILQVKDIYGKRSAIFIKL